MQRERTASTHSGSGAAGETRTPRGATEIVSMRKHPAAHAGPRLGITFMATACEAVGRAIRYQLAARRRMGVTGAPSPSAAAMLVETKVTCSSRSAAR